MWKQPWIGGRHRIGSTAWSRGGINAHVLFSWPLLACWSCCALHRGSRHHTVSAHGFPGGVNSCQEQKVWIPPLTNQHHPPYYPVAAMSTFQLSNFFAWVVAKGRYLQLLYYIVWLVKKLVTGGSEESSQAERCGSFNQGGSFLLRGKNDLFIYRKVTTGAAVKWFWVLFVFFGPIWEVLLKYSTPLQLSKQRCLLWY